MFRSGSEPVKVWTWTCVFCASHITRTVGAETREGDWLWVTCPECGRSTWIAVAGRNLFPDRRRVHLVGRRA